jgi:hypothetical protein
MRLARMDAPSEMGQSHGKMEIKKAWLSLFAEDAERVCLQISNERLTLQVLFLQSAFLPLFCQVNFGQKQEPDK